MDRKEPRYKLIVDFASAAAVVVSLVFVGLEVRETARQTELNTEAIRVAAYQDLIAQIAQFNEALLDPELALIYSTMTDPAADGAALNGVEATQAWRIFFLVARHADMAFYQFEQGLLSEDRLNSSASSLSG